MALYSIVPNVDNQPSWHHDSRYESGSHDDSSPESNWPCQTLVVVVDCGVRHRDKVLNVREHHRLVDTADATDSAGDDWAYPCRALQEIRLGGQHRDSLVGVHLGSQAAMVHLDNRAGQLHLDSQVVVGSHLSAVDSPDMASSVPGDILGYRHAVDNRVCLMGIRRFEVDNPVVRHGERDILGSEGIPVSHLDAVGSLDLQVDIPVRHHLAEADSQSLLVDNQGRRMGSDLDRRHHHRMLVGAGMRGGTDWARRNPKRMGVNIEGGIQRFCASRILGGGEVRGCV